MTVPWERGLVTMVSAGREQVHIPFRTLRLRTSGDYFHMLHHKHFDCNYSAPHAPLDWLFGTYAGSKEEVKLIWGKKPSGEEANDTALHPASTMKYAVS